MNENSEKKGPLTDDDVRRIIKMDLERAVSFLNAIRNDKELFEAIVSTATERYRVMEENKAKQPELEGL